MSKPTCPLCGQELDVMKLHEEGGWTAFCDDCTLDAGHYDTYEELVEVLSRRPGEPFGCPLCGKQPEILSSRYEGVDYYTIRCRDCFLDVGGIEGRKEAIRTWNARAR